MCRRLWLWGKIRVGEWCCKVVGSYEVQQVARCGVLLPRNLIKTFMGVSLYVCDRVVIWSTFSRRLVVRFCCEVVALASWKLTADVRLVNHSTSSYSQLPCWMMIVIIITTIVIIVIKYIFYYSKCCNFLKGNETVHVGCKAHINMCFPLSYTTPL